MPGNSVTNDNQTVLPVPAAFLRSGPPDPARDGGADPVAPAFDVAAEEAGGARSEAWRIRLGWQDSIKEECCAAEEVGLRSEAWLIRLAWNGAPVWIQLSPYVRLKYTVSDVFSAKERRKEFDDATRQFNFTKDFPTAWQALIQDKRESNGTRFIAWLKWSAWGHYSLYAINEDGSPATQRECADLLGINKSTVSKLVAYYTQRGYMIRQGKRMFPVIDPILMEPEADDSIRFQQFLAWCKVARSSNFPEKARAAENLGFTRDFFASLDVIIGDEVFTPAQRVLAWVKRRAWGKNRLYSVREDGLPARQVDCAAALGLPGGTISKTLSFYVRRGYVRRKGRLIIPVVNPEIEKVNAATFQSFLNDWKAANAATFEELELARATVKKIWRSERPPDDLPQKGNAERLAWHGSPVGSLLSPYVRRKYTVSGNFSAHADSPNQGASE